MLYLVVPFVLLFSSCSTQELSSDWYPLTTLVERPDIGNERVVTTVSPYLYTSSLDWFNETYTPGSVPYEALRRHEVTHAKRQEASSSKTLWLQRYLTDKKFRYEEEKAGYKAGIEYYIKSGWAASPEGLAETLSGKAYGSMVSYDEALIWTKKMIADAKAK